MRGIDRETWLRILGTSDQKRMEALPPLLVAWKAESRTTWDQAERAVPGCSAAWDAQGGPAWVAGRCNLTIVVLPSGISVGCGESVPYGWAIYDQRTENWLFS